MRDPVPVLYGYRCELVTDTDIGFIAYPGFYRWCNEDFDALVDQMQKLPVDDPGVVAAVPPGDGDLHRRIA